MSKKKCKCQEDVKMSVPEGMEFNTPYTMDNTLHSKYYYDYNRNGAQGYAFDQKLDIELNRISNLLKVKNRAYGDTALNPVNIFSKLNATEALCARLDDKISRIKNKGINGETEDTVDDLIGYLLLLKISM